MARRAKTTPKSDPLALAKRVRSLLADKTGDDDWRRVPAEALDTWGIYGCGPNGEDDADAASEALLNDSLEPSVFLDD